MSDSLFKRFSEVLQILWAFFSMQQDPMYSFKLDLISVAECLFPMALLNVSQQLQIINKVGLSFTGMNINY